MNQGLQMDSETTKETDLMKLINKLNIKKESPLGLLQQSLNLKSYQLIVVLEKLNEMVHEGKIFAFLLTAECVSPYPNWDS